MWKEIPVRHQTGRTGRKRNLEREHKEGPIGITVSLVLQGRESKNLKLKGKAN